MNIEIAEDTARMIQAVIASGSVDSAPAYIRALVREDQLTRQGLNSFLNSSGPELEKLAIKGLESGEPIEADEAFWQERKLRITEKP